MKTRGKQMKTRGNRPDGIVFVNAVPRYAGKLDDPQGGNTTVLMQQVREVMTVNQEMTDESSWIWLTSEQMGFPFRSKVANENHGEARSSKQCNDPRTDQTAFFWRLSSQISFETQKGTSMMRSSKTRLKSYIWNGAKTMTPRRRVQLVEHQSTSPRKCVQQEWSSTGKTADAVGSTFQTAGR